MPTYVSSLLINSGIAAAYFGFGKLGLMLALPPGYATAIWPPAGIVFAACMIWGSWRVWSGVFTGALLLNVFNGVTPNFGWLPVVIAVGSTLQAVVGSRLLRHFDPGLQLDRPRNVARFSLAAMAACVIAALIGNLALLSGGVMVSAQFLPNLLTWWMGDALGVLIFTPLMLVIFDRREVWRGRRLQVGLPLLAAFLLCGAVYEYIRDNEDRQLSYRFQEEAREATRNLRLSGGFEDRQNLVEQLGRYPGLSWVVRDSTGAVLVRNANFSIPDFSASTHVDHWGVYYREGFAINGQNVQLILHKPYRTLAAETAISPSLLVLLLALAACGILGNIALIVSGDRKRISQEVDRKTQALSAEIERRKQREADLRASEHWFKTLFENAPVGHAINRVADGRFVRVNKAFASIVGYSAEELQLLTYMDLTPPGYAAQDAEQLDLVGRHGHYGPYEKRLLCKDGKLVAVRLNGSRLLGEGGDELVLSVVEDVTAWVSAQQRIQLLAKVFEHSNEGFLITDADNRILEVNQAFTSQTGYTLDDVRGRDPSLLASGRTSAAEYDEMWLALRERGSWQGEIWDRHKDGHIYPKWLSISVVRDATGAISHHIASFTDITEHKAAEERIHYLAHHDPLTRLPNRFNLQGRLEHAVVAARRDQVRLAVMFIDMDRFKNINDTLGHQVGDALLVEVARRLESGLRESDIVARLGGDEFVVVLTEIERAGAVAIAEKIQASLGQVYQIAGRELHSTPSMGISLFPEDGETVEELMKNADTAMYQAKSAGRNNFQFYAASMNADAAERVQIEAGLRQALERGELVLHYQPQIEIASGRVIGVEALVRWQHPQQGLVPPLKFIPVAEETGQIAAIGEWVIHEALRQLRAWRDQGISALRMAVNLSAHQLRNDQIAFSVAAALAAYGLSDGDLELEITESVAMQHPRRTAGLLSTLRDHGVELAIDDFGTGYSSLAYLKQLPLDRLKLDRSFVMDIEHDANDAAISAATISLAHSLGLAVVAEGVETQAQLDFLHGLGCDIAQGYHFSKPLAADACFAYLQKMSGSGRRVRVTQV